MPRLTQRLVDLYEEGRFDKTDRRQPSRNPPSMAGLAYVRRYLNRSVGKGWNNVTRKLHHELAFNVRHHKLRAAAGACGYSLLDLVKFYVFTNVVYVGKVPCVCDLRHQVVPLRNCRYQRGFYVDRQGILRRQPKFEYDPKAWPAPSKS